MKTFTLFLLTAFLGSASNLAAQAPFTRLTTGSPLARAAGTGANYYNGVAWVDIDNDGDLDCIYADDAVYINDGTGNLAPSLTGWGGTNFPRGRSSQGFSWSGMSWADFDNDGRIDGAASGRALTVFRNTRSASGSAMFTALSATEFPPSAAGFSCAWADYDNDGFVDLVASGFSSDGLRNRLYRNNQNGTFTMIDTSVVTRFDAPFTIPTWSDYDGDGDIDLFFGAGPGGGGNVGADYMFKNMLKESGRAYFERITTLNIIQEQRDGQVWNWVDYDNDGDLDVYITNYGATTNFTGMANHLYRNDRGAFTKITDAGDLVTDEMASLASVWQDFDNDGDLDCIVSNDAANPLRYYENNGSGRFTGSDLIPRGTSRYGAAAGDFDNDGDVDFFVIGATTAATGLFRNDAASNGNAWSEIRLVGVRSNRSAIGAKVRVKATFGGKAVWQMREISAQNSFQGQNMLTAHFGLKDAQRLDSVIVEWTSGAREILTNLAAKQILTITEGRGTTSVHEQIASKQDSETLLRHNAPNPFVGQTMLSYRLAKAGFVRLVVYNALGQEVAMLVNGEQAAGEYSLPFAYNGVAGMLTARLTSGMNTSVVPMIVKK